MTREEKHASTTIRARAFESTKTMTANELAEVIKKAGDGFLRSEEWLMLRANAIAKHGCRCMRCGTKMKTLSSINVDHIKPRSLFPHLAFDIDNLQILCGPCNKLKCNRHDTDYRQPRVWPML